MRKILITAAVFVISAIAGVILTVLLGMSIGFVRVLFTVHNHQSGIGAVSGGISEFSVMLVPVLWGVIGTLIVLHRLERKERLG